MQLSVTVFELWLFSISVAYQKSISMLENLLDLAMPGRMGSLEWGGA
jgi:hypothetical protein